MLEECPQATRVFRYVFKCIFVLIVLNNSVPILVFKLGYISLAMHEKVHAVYLESVRNVEIFDI